MAWISHTLESYKFSDDSEAMKVIEGLTRGHQRLQEQEIVHRDLSIDNCYVEVKQQDINGLIAHFRIARSLQWAMTGNAKVLRPMSPRCNIGKQGTGTQAPEIAYGSPTVRDRRSDWWPFGVALATIWLEEGPFEGMAADVEEFEGSFDSHHTGPLELVVSGKSKARLFSGTSEGKGEKYHKSFSEKMKTTSLKQVSAAAHALPKIDPEQRRSPDIDEKPLELVQLEIIDHVADCLEGGWLRSRYVCRATGCAYRYDGRGGRAGVAYRYDGRRRR